MAEAVRKQPGRFRSMARTAVPLAELLASLVAPVDGDRVYDPACGCGTLLAKVRQKVSNGDVSLHGQECDPANLTLCKMNMLLRDIHDAVLWLGETLSDPQNIKDDRLTTFSIVVADPPFGLRHWDRRVLEGKKNSSDAWWRFEWGVPMIGDFAFTLHALKCLDAEGGRMAILLPHGALTRGGTDREIRRRIVENNLLDAVVGLSPKLCGGVRVSGNAYLNGGYPMNMYDISSTLVYTDEEREESEEALFNVDICGDFEISGYASIMHGAKLRSSHDFYVEGPITDEVGRAAKRKNENYLTVYKTNTDSIAVVFRRQVFDIEDWVEYLNGLVKLESGYWKQLQLAFNNAMVHLFG